MTVRELIELLEELDRPQAAVIVQDDTIVYDVSDIKYRPSANQVEII